MPSFAMSMSLSSVSSTRPRSVQSKISPTTCDQNERVVNVPGIGVATQVSHKSGIFLRPSPTEQ